MKLCLLLSLPLVACAVGGPGYPVDHDGDAAADAADPPAPLPPTAGTGEPAWPRGDPGYLGKPPWIHVPTTNEIPDPMGVP